jgi:hypothetical protein
VASPHAGAGLEALVVHRGDGEDRGVELDRDVLELLGLSRSTSSSAAA